MLGTRLAAASFFAAFFVPNVWAGPVSYRSTAHCGEKRCNGNGVCEKIDIIPSELVEIKCICNDGFIGERCEIETMLSQRCYLRPKALHEANQIPGIEGCPDGQWCVPDNFYCHFYGCDDSIGWCIKASGAFTSTANHGNQPTRPRNRPAGSRVGKDFEEELLGDN